MKRLLLLLLIALPLAAEDFSVDFLGPVTSREWWTTNIGIKATGTFSGPVTVTYSWRMPQGYGNSGTVVVSPQDPLDAFTAYYNDDLYSPGQTGSATISYTIPGTTQSVSKSIEFDVEDDEPEPTITFDDLRVYESDPQDVYLVRYDMTPRSTVPISITFSVAPNGTATSPDDFVFIETGVTIPPGSSGGSLSFRLVKDGVAEDAEVFFPTCTGRCVGGTVTILDARAPASIAPDAVEVYVGEYFNLDVVLPESQPATVQPALSSSNPGVAAPLDSRTLPAIPRGTWSTTVPMGAFGEGDATITATFPGWTKLAPATAVVHVFGGEISVDRDSLVLDVGQEQLMTVRLNPAPPQPLVLTIVPLKNGVVSVPSEVAIETSGSGTFNVKGKVSGDVRIELRTPTNRLVSLVDVQVAPPLTLSAIAPNSGPVAGGTNVTITGKTFRGACSVSFGGVPATGVTIASETSLRAVAPPHAAGAFDVAVSCDGNTATLPRAFTYRKSSHVRSVRH